MHIENLRYVVAVTQTRSFTAAARDYGVTQPALSNGIARLEEELGGRLFDRSPRGVAPTELGLRLLPLIERAVNNLDAIVAEARRGTDRDGRAVRMGVSPLIDAGLVSAAFTAVRALTPPRTLVLREANMDELREQLATGNLDMILVPAVTPMPRYRHLEIAREGLVVVTTEPGTTPIEVTAIGDDPLILMADTCGLTRFTENLLEANNRPFHRYSGEAMTYRVLEDWARLGLGAALLPKSKLAEVSTAHRPLTADGHNVEIAYEAIWCATTNDATDLESLATNLAASHHAPVDVETSSTTTPAAAGPDVPSGAAHAHDK
ncbi:MAG: LysR family transcriptional regulator [Trebonia sp.]